VTDRLVFSPAVLLAIATKAARRISLHATLATHRLLSTFGHHDYVHFIVLTRSRTGSNLLLSFLNSHPHVFCEGEIFATMQGADPVARLRRAFGKQPRHVRAKGFKIFYYHPLDAKADGLWRELENREDIRVIHLTRENILRTLVSRKIAGIKGAWTGTRFDPAEAEDKRVTFTVSELEAGFRETRGWEESAAVRFLRHPVLAITYEELVRNSLDVNRRLLEFLGVKTVVPHTDLRHQNPENLRELIRNYDELKQNFAGTSWGKFFDA
jgi:LPS sulfotransferase NodH